MLEIRFYGDPVLRKTALPVTVFDSNLKRFVDEMIEAMIEKDGVGLAAPQVGEPVRIAVIDTTGGEQEPIVLINPEFTYKSEELVEAEEGCLSLPGIDLNVTRPKIVSIKAFNSEGKELIISNAEGLLARALQHEIDHLNGIMIVDHISHLQKKMLSTRLKKLNQTDSEKSETT